MRARWAIRPGLCSVGCRLVSITSPSRRLRYTILPLPLPAELARASSCFAIASRFCRWRKNQTYNGAQHLASECVCRSRCTVLFLHALLARASSCLATASRSCRSSEKPSMIAFRKRWLLHVAVHDLALALAELVCTSSCVAIASGFCSWQGVRSVRAQTRLCADQMSTQDGSLQASATADSVESFTLASWPGCAVFSWTRHYIECQGGRLSAGLHWHSIMQTWIRGAQRQVHKFIHKFIPQAPVWRG